MKVLSRSGVALLVASVGASGVARSRVAAASVRAPASSASDLRRGASAILREQAKLESARSEPTQGLLHEISRHTEPRIQIAWETDMASTRKPSNMNG